MSPEDITAKVRDAPDAVKNCATDDKVFSTRGGCELLGASACPFQEKRMFVSIYGNKLPVCTRHHPHHQKK
jgi:hypothetical protein